MAFERRNGPIGDHHFVPHVVMARQRAGYCALRRSPVACLPGKTQVPFAARHRVPRSPRLSAERNPENHAVMPTGDEEVVDHDGVVVEERISQQV
jgi:hypothetical protein